MKIRTELILGFLMIAILVGAMGLVGIHETSEIYNKEIIEHTHHMLLLDNMRSTLHDQGHALLRYQAAQEESYLEEYNKESQEFMKLLEIKRDVSCSRCLNVLAQMQLEYDTYLETNKEVIQAIAKGDENERTAMLLLRSDEVSKRIGSCIDQLLDNEDTCATTGDEKLQEAISDTTRDMIAVSILVILLAVCIGLIIHSHIAMPLHRLGIAARKFSKGDLEPMIENCADDEIGDLARSFEAMRNGLRDRNDLLKCILETFRGKYGETAIILMRKDIAQLVRKNPRIARILPQGFNRTIEERRNTEDNKEEDSLRTSDAWPMADDKDMKDDTTLRDDKDDKEEKERSQGKRKR